ncbi:hypothetical protein SVIO_043970 [Streptomyces violaceusniger]|uniref:Uncharacterized protein n=1 Tax=Streptomyces violaceusniger TaxID=68280 RepID=A0A4D4L019_STRVO|nr:hypothetical protein SVIO_043970 [Streptomyces violaceusniger]
MPRFRASRGVFSRTGSPSGVGTCAALSLVTFVAIPIPPGGLTAHPQIAEGREQQHHADGELEPIGVPVGVDDALVDHADDEGAEDRADRGAGAAGEQAAADHGRDDGVELVAHALAGLHGVVPSLSPWVATVKTLS